MKIVIKLVVKLFGFVCGGLKRILTALQRFSAAIGLFFSFVLASASVASSFFVSTKPLFGVPLGVLLSAVGCFASGWIFAVCLRKVGFLGSSERELSNQLDQQKKGNAQLSSEITKLRAEKERLEKQRIDINAFRPILQLGLAQADMTITDVAFDWMDDFDNGYIYDTQSQYVGVLRQSFKAVYGVDLAKLRIREEPKVLRVVGIEPENLGVKDYKSKWLLRAAQKFKLKKISSISEWNVIDQVEHKIKEQIIHYEKDKEKPFDGSMNLNPIAKYFERQENSLRDRINNVKGAEFRTINDYIQKMARGFVEMLLAPVKKAVVFDNTISFADIDGKNEWLVLEDFAKSYNEKIGVPIQITGKRILAVCDEQVIAEENNG